LPWSLLPRQESLTKRKRLAAAIETRSNPSDFNANDTAFAYKELASCLYEAASVTMCKSQSKRLEALRRQLRQKQ